MRISAEWSQRVVLGVIVLLFCVRNLPWHLDNFDQAKQAYVSFEMVEQGHWWYQHTPTQNVATKPPLAGWISAALYFVTRWWDGAWRLPSFASALVILWMLARRQDAGAPVAAAAFGLNAFAPRLATLARTDMLLTLFIFLIGWIIFEKIRTGAAWTPRDRWAVFFLALGSMITKGPIVYAFLLPGIVAFSILRRRNRLEAGAWSGWWSWFVPLVFVGIWAAVGSYLDRAFYDQVVLKEFLGRFTTGEHAVHKTQPVYFYATHLLLRFAPWSVLLLALLCVKKVRAAIASKPHLLWLVCWAGGGLLLMSLIPSKRPDRIFPVIPPLSLLVACLLAELGEARVLGLRALCAAWGFIAAAAVCSGGYTAFDVIKSFRTDQGGLVEFGRQVRATAAAHGWRYETLGAKDEGMLLYLRRPRFLKPHDVRPGWENHTLQGLVMSGQDLKESGESFQPYRVVLSTPAIPEKNGRYFFVVPSEAVGRH